MKKNETRKRATLCEDGTSHTTIFTRSLKPIYRYTLYIYNCVAGCFQIWSSNSLPTANACALFSSLQSLVAEQIREDEDCDAVKTTGRTD